MVIILILIREQGEFITYADGKDKRLQFRLQKIQRGLPTGTKEFSNAELEANFERIYKEAKSLFNNY